MPRKRAPYKPSEALLDSIWGECHKSLGLIITHHQAIAIAQTMVKFNESLRDELKGWSKGSYLDTYQRDYMTMAVVELVIPGPPTAQDPMMDGHEEWHWPCNGSGRAYAWAFYKAFKAGAKRAKFKLVESVWRDV